MSSKTNRQNSRRRNNSHKSDNFDRIDRKLQRQIRHRTNSKKQNNFDFSFRLIDHLMNDNATTPTSF